MAILLGTACFLTYYFHEVLGTGAVFTHSFYIPIILAALWWKRKGLFVAIFLAAVLILSHIFLRPDVSSQNDYFRGLMFIGVSLVTVMLSERIARTEETIEHLNLVLRAIRNINQLIAKEKDRDRLLNGICHALIESRSYHNAWLSLIDESGKLVATAEAGLGKDFLLVVERLKRSELTACGQKALKQADVVVTKDPSSTCADCPLAKNYAGRGAMAVRLEHGRKIYGLLSVSTTAEFAADEEEQALLKEVAGDVAFALHSIELEEERKKAEKEVKKYAEQLKQANIHLQEMDRLKSIFLASMSHELRTPLNSIIGFTGVILMGIAGEVNEEQRKQLTMVKNSANHLLSLINDILDISKIEADKVVLSLEEFSLDSVVREVVESVSPMVSEKGLELVAEVPEGITLFSDRRRTKQVLMNLVSNAVKFTERGSVRIAARVTGDENLELRVIDTGVGIKKEDMYKLFQPFQQVDISLTKKYEGTGLGLYLTKKLVDVLGRDISAKSEYGRGSEFTFTLPLRYKEV